MGVGFNSIYHLTDSPSFITDDKYVILDPHGCYDGSKKFNFVKNKLAKVYPNQFFLLESRVMNHMITYLETHSKALSSYSLPLYI